MKQLKIFNSQTSNQSFGDPGDVISYILITPQSLSPGAVSLVMDTAEIVVFSGGEGSLTDLIPFRIDLGAKTSLNPWAINVGENVKVYVFGDFSS